MMNESEILKKLPDLLSVNSRIAAGAGDDEISYAREFARELGVAFQIEDDVLEAEEDGESSDSKNGKVTYVSLYGVEKAKELGKIISAHCEDNSLLLGGYIHDGEYARLHGHKGICSESEWGPIKRDIELARKTGSHYHVCHISTKESVDIIRKAKAEGVDITCETGPHYLVLDDSFLKEDGRYKMNPPLRSKEDREALIEGIKDGTIDMIATDHAPHSAEEKARGLEKSAFGIVGIETAFPVLYTHLVKEGIVSLEKILELLITNPRKRFNIPLGNDFSIWDFLQERLPS